MPFPRRLLIENEELVLELRPHWIAIVVPAIVTVLVVAGWILALTYAPDDGTSGIVVWGASAIGSSS
jgi:hypothetical protein